MKEIGMTNEQLCLLARKGDPASLNALVENILPSIRIAASKIIKDNSWLQIESDDLVQEASIGFLRAIKTFNPDKNTLFRTFASSVTDHAMLDYIRRYSTEIRQSGGASLSLDAPPPDFDSTEMTYAEVLIDEYALSPEQIFIKKETILIVRKALSMVSKREQEYLHYRYGFIDDIEHDRKETAYHFRLTVSRAKRLEKDALENCRRHLEGKI